MGSHSLVIGPAAVDQINQPMTYITRSTITPNSIPIAKSGCFACFRLGMLRKIMNKNTVTGSRQVIDFGRGIESAITEEYRTVGIGSHDL